jgi:hypothetical protein
MVDAAGPVTSLRDRNEPCGRTVGLFASSTIQEFWLERSLRALKCLRCAQGPPERERRSQRRSSASSPSGIRKTNRSSRSDERRLKYWSSKGALRDHWITSFAGVGRVTRRAAVCRRLTATP